MESGSKRDTTLAPVLPMRSKTFPESGKDRIGSRHRISAEAAVPTEFVRFLTERYWYEIVNDQFSLKLKSSACWITIQN